MKVPNDKYFYALVAFAILVTATLVFLQTGWFAVLPGAVLVAV
jgi:hypothetical protein